LKLSILNIFALTTGTAQKDTIGSFASSLFLEKLVKFKTL